jgi:DNA-binding transcriptional regulator YbjK
MTTANIDEKGGVKVERTSAADTAHKLYQKHYAGKKNKIKKENKAIVERAKEEPKKETRNDLMLQAKAQGVKNYRVLSKQDLVRIVVEKAEPQIVDEIVAAAVAKWKAGWGKRKNIAA